MKRPIHEPYPHGFNREPGMADYLLNALPVLIPYAVVLGLAAWAVWNFHRADQVVAKFVGGGM